MQETALDKDTTLSHSILNYLYSLYQSEYSWQNSLIQLGSTEYSQETLKSLGEQLQKIFDWYKGLSKGDCVFAAAWTSPQTFDAQNALKMLAASKPWTSRAAQRVRAAIINSQQSPSTSTIWDLVAGFVRFTTGSKFYNQGFIELGQTLKRPKIEELYKVPAQFANQQYALSHRFLSETLKEKNNELRPEILSSLRQNCLPIPGGLRSQIHDINQLLARYNPSGFDFRAAEFSPAEAELWQAQNIQADAAGYWRAYDFSPQEAVDWTLANIGMASVAANWKFAQFDHKSATVWAKEGFPPMIARKWADAGYGVVEAMTYVKKGIPDPDKLPKGE